MEFHRLINDSIADTLTSLWPAFAPEAVIALTILLTLIVRLLPGGNRLNSFWLALAGSAIALYYTGVLQFLGGQQELGRRELFTGMLVYDNLTVYMRALLMTFAILFVVFTRISGIPDKEDSGDFYCLILGGLLGMCLMASANHLLMVFLAVEMASVPSYALAGLLKGRRESSEAALKYAVYGAGAAGVMLYGISLLAGITNTAHLPTLAARLTQLLPAMEASQFAVLSLAGLMIMVGLAFKLSAFPFHFWCPDVFEGASSEVNAYLSVASKAAALALLVRVAIGVSFIPTQSAGETEQTSQVAVAESSGFFAVADDVHKTDENAEGQGNAGANMDTVRNFICLLVGILAAVTCTFGNLAAYAQTNIKRLLAYSTIAHAGYMMLPVPAAVALASQYPDSARRAISALALYIAVYLFMNLGAFAIVAFLRNSIRSEEISDYAGLVRRSPGVVICFSVILFSLIGLPPLAGFVGKFAVFASLADGYKLTGQTFLLTLLVVGGINTAISLFYYLRVIKTMVIDPAPEGALPAPFSSASMAGAYMWAVTLPIVILFISWDTLNQWTLAAGKSLF